MPYPINRMSINAFDVQSQQLIAKTVFEEAISKRARMLIAVISTATNDTLKTVASITQAGFTDAL